MQLRRIARADRSRDAALCIPRVAFLRLSLRQNEHSARTRQLHGCAQPRDTTSDDEKVCLQIHALVRSCYPTIRHFAPSPT